MKRPAVKFALIALGFTIVWIFFENLMGFHSMQHDIGQYTRMMPVLIFSLVIFIVIYYARRGFGHSLTWMEGFKVGLLMSLIYAFGFTVELWIYTEFINPEFSSSYREFTLQQLQEVGASQALTDSKMKQHELFYGGTARSHIILFLISFLWGALISAIASLIWMKKPKVVS